jgi:hypothetical protein
VLIIIITVVLYVMPCSLVEKHQHFTETFAFNSEDDEGSMLMCNGASLPLRYSQQDSDLPSSSS